jgi:glycosyltransferase involved in cell wall biosynthesis
MRVAFVCNEYPPGAHGGIGTVVRTLGRALVAAGHTVRVVGTYDVGWAGAARECDRGVDVWRLRRAPGRLGWIAARRQLFDVVHGWARAGEIDVVEVPDWEGMAAGWPRLDVPVVARCSGSATYFQAELGAPVRGGTRLLEGRSLRRADRWCAVSRYTADRTRRLFGLPTAGAVLHNGIELPPAPAGAARDARRVVFSGTLVRKKGVVSLMRAWNAVAARRPDAELHVYGKEGEIDGVPAVAALRRVLTDAARARVVFHGHVDRDALGAALDGAGIAVFPSYAEAFAMAPLEAMAHGCAVVYSQRGSGPELIDDGRDGMLVDPDAPAGIADALLTLLDDPARAAQLAAAGHARVRTEFSIDVAAARTAAFHASAVEEFPARRPAGRRVATPTRRTPDASPAPVALLLPDGVGVRNFVLGEFAERTAARGPVLALHALSDDLVARYAALAPGFDWRPLLAHRPARLTELLGSATGYAHMYWLRTAAMRRRLGQPIVAKTRGRLALIRAARALGRAAASPRGIATLERLYHAAVERSPAFAHYRALFARTRPAVLFCTQQRAPLAVAPVLAARALGIPTVAFIFSWDNLSSKQRIAAPFEHYCVWSDAMRDELRRYYPDVPCEAIHVVGAPQFDAYADARALWSREEFCRRVGADPARPIVCYSGGDTGTCPDDAHHVAILLRLIREGRIPGEPQVLLRPSPVDDGRRYAAVRREFPELLYAPPAWVHTVPGDWSRVAPLPEDLAMLANVTFHCAVNVNVASTMTLDFALRDRPVVNVAFDASSPPPLERPLRDVYYRYEHYAPVLTLGAARLAHDADELAAHVRDYLADPSLDREGRAALAAYEVASPVGGAGARVADVLHRLARRSVDARPPRVDVPAGDVDAPGVGVEMPATAVAALVATGGTA